MLRPEATGPHSGAKTPKYFCCPQNFVVFGEFLLKYIMNQNYSHSKNIFFPKTLKPGYGPAVGSGIFQQDHTPCHTSKRSKHS